MSENIITVKYKVNVASYCNWYNLDNLALEEDEAPGLHVAEEGRLLRVKAQALTAEDGGLDAHRTKQLRPVAFSRSQKAVASAREPKPVT